VRVIFLGHACYLVESGKHRVLTDPWLTDPIFEGRIERDPPLAFSVSDMPPFDAIVLTHAHLDHFNAPTLATIADKSVPVIHPRVTFTELDANLRLLGFSNLIPLNDFESHDIGSIEVTATPSRGVMDECAYLFTTPTGRFWNGADAPQVPEVIAEIAARHGRIDVGAFSHNSFDQPALLGLPSFKPADHAPAAAIQAARLLGVRAAIPGASNMRWCGKDGAALTRKAIRRSREDFLARLAAVAPEVMGLDLQPGDAWSRDGGVARAVVRGRAAIAPPHDYVHPYLGTGARWCRTPCPSTEDLCRRDLPARLAAARCAAANVGNRVFVEIEGDDAGAYTVDFRTGESAAGDRGAAYGFKLGSADWKGLFERRHSWQVLMTSDRLRVTRYVPGPPPAGLHFVYAMQGIFP
jgi:L-ascorbate metabolism protein UlaG (beta-lactamase superfamily)